MIGARALVPVLLITACAPKVARGPVAVEEAAAPVVVRRVEAAIGDAVRLTVGVDVGSAHDPLGREGLAWVTAHAVARSFDEHWTEHGGTVDVTVGRFGTVFDMTCGSEQADACLSWAVRSVVAPRLPPEGIRDLTDAATTWLTDGLTAHADKLATELLDAWIFEAHPQGHPVQGRTGVLGTLGAADVAGFHRDHYVREAVSAELASGPQHDGLTVLTDGWAQLPATLPPDDVFQSALPVAQPRGLVVRGLATRLAVGRAVPPSTSGDARRLLALGMQAAVLSGDAAGLRDLVGEPGLAWQHPRIGLLLETTDEHPTSALHTMVSTLNRLGREALPPAALAAAWSEAGHGGPVPDGAAVRDAWAALLDDGAWTWVVVSRAPEAWPAALSAAVEGLEPGRITSLAAAGRFR